MEKIIYLKNLFMNEAHELRSTLPELVGYENCSDNSRDLNGYDGHGRLDIISEEIFEDEDESIIYTLTHERWVDAFKRIVFLNKDGTIRICTKSYAINEYSDQDEEKFVVDLDFDGGIKLIEVIINDEKQDLYNSAFEGEEYTRLHLAGDIVRITRIVDALMKDIRAIEKKVKEAK